MKNNTETYHFIYTFLNTHIFHFWRHFYAEQTSLSKGRHKNQGCVITIIIFKDDLEHSSIWL